MVAFAAESNATTGTANTPNKQGSTGGAWLMIVIYILFFVVVGYFLIYRPNKKRKKQEEELRGSIILGDEVTTIGGIVGKVVNIKDDNITIETSIDKTLMEFKNWAIRDVKKLITDDEPESK
ncbi:MAG: preprotein translocase subunit YajC [Clostridia bacterium]|nr:preprotein translocase subunit YajC [Clostridia bacterium]